jgi:predicted alpha/beta hydrolase
MDTSQQKITITASDGFTLYGYELLPVNRHVAATVQLNPATGVKKEFYLRFAHYLAGCGYRVLVFDYRGIGESRSKSLRGFKATMLQWVVLDMNAITNFILQQYAQQPLIWMGHSIGAQLMGLIENRQHIQKVIAVNTSTGYWKHFRFPYNAGSWFLWNAFLPVTTRLLGYAPTSRYGLGEDLPTGVARQWARWCTSGHHFKNDLLALTGKPVLDDFTAPIQFVFTNDDYIATRNTVERLAAFYPAAAITYTEITAAQAGVTKIGHVGLFRQQVRQTVWPLLARMCDDVGLLPR